MTTEGHRVLDRADLAWRQGRLDYSAQLASGVLAVDRSKSEQARAVTTLAMVQLLDGATNRAFRTFSEAAAMLADVAPEPGLARAWADLAILAFAVGDDDALHVLAAHAMVVAGSEDDRSARARAWNIAGLSLFQQAGTSDRQLEESLTVLPLLLSAQQQQDLVEARRHFDQAAIEGRLAGDEVIVLVATINALTTVVHEGRAHEVVVQMRAASEQLARHHSPWSLVNALHYTATAEIQVGHLAAAIELLERARTLAIDSGLTVFRGSLQLALIALYRAADQPERALALVDDMVAMRRRNDVGRVACAARCRRRGTAGCGRTPRTSAHSDCPLRRPLAGRPPIRSRRCSADRRSSPTCRRWSATLVRSR